MMGRHEQAVDGGRDGGMPQCTRSSSSGGWRGRQTAAEAAAARASGGCQRGLLAVTDEATDEASLMRDRLKSVTYGTERYGAVRFM